MAAAVAAAAAINEVLSRGQTESGTELETDEWRFSVGGDPHSI